MLVVLTWGCATTANRAPTLVERPVEASTNAFGPNLRVVVWNVHKRADPVFEQDLRVLLDSSRTDLLLLQEAAIGLDSSIRSGALGKSWWSFSANLSDSSRRLAFGVMTAGLVPSLENEALLTEATEPVLKTPKAMLATRHRTSAGTIRVVNVHGLNFSMGLDGFRRQLAQIASVVESETGAVIVAGDFNTWTDAKQELVDSVLGSNHLARVDFGSQARWQKRAFGLPLDHIYYTPRWLEIEPGSQQVLRDISTSDHAPLRVQFRFR